MHFSRLLCNLIFFFQEVIRHHVVKIGTRSLLLLESTKNVSSHLNKIMKQRSSLHLSPSRLNQIKTNYRGNTWSPCTILMEGNLNPVPMTLTNIQFPKVPKLHIFTFESTTFFNTKTQEEKQSLKINNTIHIPRQSWSPHSNVYSSCKFCNQIRKIISTKSSIH